MPEEEREAMQGIVVTIMAHKTAAKGTVDLWLNSSDVLLIQAYIIMVQRYADKHNMKYDMSSVVFVNKNCTAWKTSTRTINYGLFMEATGISHYTAHDGRRMFGGHFGSYDNIHLREAAALASNHR